MAGNPGPNANLKPVGILPNLYADLLPPNLTKAGAPGQDGNAQPKSEEKKQKLAVPNLFHNPHAIKRPQAKGNKTVKKPMARAAVPSSSSDTKNDSPAVTKKFEDFAANEDEDAENVAKAQEVNRLRNRERKMQKKLEKQYQGFRPDREYEIRNPTKVDVFRTEPSMMAVVMNGFNNYLREARGQEPISKPQGSDDDGDDSGNSEFIPYSLRETTDATEPPPYVEVAQTQEEVFEHRRRLAQERYGYVPEQIDDAPSVDEDLMEEESTDKKPADSDFLQKRLSEIKAHTAASLRAAETKSHSFASDDFSSAEPQPLSGPTTIVPPPPPPPPPPGVGDSATISAAPVHYSYPPPPGVPVQSTISAPPIHYDRPPPPPGPSYSHTISAPPIHYDRPSKSAENGPVDERPNRKRKANAPPEPEPLSKAERMMAKMGHKKGEGLGKDSSGITTALELTLQGHSSMGSGDSRKIGVVLGGERNQEAEPERFGKTSKVVVSWGCVDGVDFAADADRDDGGIRQDMGDFFSQKFGDIERIHISMGSTPSPVYIKFRETGSALNAVNRFSEGFEFQGRRIKAEFYDEDAFNSGSFKH
ncbi:hypothetical protein CC78DRAFT_612657 [Lojkania enalia]|uniref:G-patch domain-containing protein n=1 Tax=Lojkania enalia TaxID=147567 RepID=A0A9P4N9P6_9PLEO|nr:hypothetical protein CC78DRAFT_612657 [Didymosphaeria enalia]